MTPSDDRFFVDRRCGCALLGRGRIAPLAWFVGPPVALVDRIQVEERALCAAHGDRYAAGAARHRLVPGIW